MKLSDIIIAILIIGAWNCYLLYRMKKEKLNEKD
tara:strand:- start:3920 stop:4021 length:102 start_codon:yes stop_codon:yes gene_type:complete